MRVTDTKKITIKQDYNIHSSFKVLLEKNEQFKHTYANSAIMRLINGNLIQHESCRNHLLGLIQTLSNYFQKIVLLRSVFADAHPFKALATEHLKEEFCHNEELMAERNFQPPVWDPVLEAICSWFTWKMFNSTDEDKIVLIHLVLETSASIFFQSAFTIMQKYSAIEYFKVHSEADEKHEYMGKELLENLSEKQYQKLMETQFQGWEMMLAACDRIAALVTKHADKFDTQKFTVLK